MPGISGVFSCGALSGAKIEASCRDLQHRGNYKVTRFYQKDEGAICFSGYEGYPSHCYEDEKVLILFEGLAYDKGEEEIHNLLRKIADDYCQKGEYRRRIVEFIENFDGDYIVLIYFKDEEAMIIFNDRWGRLPTFFFAEDRIFAFSRETKFLLHWMSSIEFDPIAMTEFLIYEYNLGRKTLVKGIRRLNPASLLEVRFPHDQICLTEEDLLPVNFETIDLCLSRDEIVKQCVRLYMGSLSVRARKIQEKGLYIVADLSGGHDTRAVFAGLCRIDVPFTPCTDDPITGDESFTARRLTEAFGKTLCKCSASHPVDTFPILRDITYLTDCTVNGWTAVSCYYDSLEREKSFAKPTATFMGFGGEFIRHPYRLKKRYPSLIAMLEDAIFSRYLPFLWACAITKVDPEDFGKNLVQEIARFPEREEQDKAKHLYFEYYNKLVNAGENRHRIFSWTVQPFWGKNLFTFETKHIPAKLISHTFFIDFLGTLDRRLLKVPIYGSHLRLDSRVGVALYEVKMRTKEMLRGNRRVFNLYKWTLRKLHRNGKKYALLDEVRRMCQDRFVSMQFDVAATEEFLRRSPENIEIYQLLTLMSYVAEVGRRFDRKVSAGRQGLTYPCRGC